MPHKRPASPSVMQVEFQDHYIIVVVLVLWVLCCCRGFLEILCNGMQELDKCMDLSCCDLRGLRDCQDPAVCSVFLKRVVLLFCFLQPLLLCLVRVADKEKHMDWHTTVRLYALVPGQHYNWSTAGTEPHVATAELDVYEIDFLVMAMPLAVMTSLNCLCFSHWSAMLNGDTDWDDAVGGSEEWFLYETTYYLQTLCMSWLLLALACNENTVSLVYYSGLAISLLLWFFMAASRFPQETTADHWGGSIAFLLLFAALIPLWEGVGRQQCSLYAAAGLVHGAAVFLLVIGHYTAFGRKTASYICALRFGVTIIYSVFNMVVLALGDSQCAHARI